VEHPFKLEYACLDCGKQCGVSSVDWEGIEFAAKAVGFHCAECHRKNFAAFMEKERALLAAWQATGGPN
jgi:DNA-directed RNA polymerase subunit RPC12/RpoP